MQLRRRLSNAAYTERRGISRPVKRPQPAFQKLDFVRKRTSRTADGLEV